VIKILEQIFRAVARSIPNLKLNMLRAGIYESPMGFVKKTAITAFYLTMGIMLIFFMILSKKNMTGILIPLFPIVFVMMFLYLTKLPDLKIIQKEKEINREIVAAGRFIIIEISSGVSLYNTMRSMAEHYVYVGKHFRNILQKVDMGTAMDDALNDEVGIIPSNNLRRMMWQIINSLKTGSDMATSLQVVLDQISREQFIEVEKYGRKLNPLAMFYMMIAVIIPSLGITMLVILSSFIDIELGVGVLLIIAGFLGFVQFMFLSIIKAQRPAVDL